MASITRGKQKRGFERDEKMKSGKTAPGTGRRNQIILCALPATDAPAEHSSFSSHLQVTTARSHARARARAARERRPPPPQAFRLRALLPTPSGVNKKKEKKGASRVSGEMVKEAPPPESKCANVLGEREEMAAAGDSPRSKRPGEKAFNLQAPNAELQFLASC